MLQDYQLHAMLFAKLVSLISSLSRCHLCYELIPTAPITPEEPPCTAAVR